MPSAAGAWVAVARTLGDLDPDDQRGVEAFYARTLPNYPDPVRLEVGDFLAACVTEPTAEELGRLRAFVDSCVGGNTRRPAETVGSGDLPSA